MWREKNYIDIERGHDGPPKVPHKRAIKSNLKKNTAMCFFARPRDDILLVRLAFCRQYLTRSFQGSGFFSLRKEAKICSV